MTAAGWYALGIALVAACIGGLVVWAARLDGNGGHTHRAVRRRAADPFAGPADAADPDGERFIAELRPAGRFPYCRDEDEADAGWWRQAAPAGRVEVITGPGARIAATSQLVAAVLARVQDAVPGDPGGPGDPCDTGEFGALLGSGRGLWTGRQEADRLAAKYLTAPEATP